jgi:hypothetical protein
VRPSRQDSPVMRHEVASGHDNETTVLTLSKGNLKCNDEKSLHASNSCPKYVILSTLDLTIALVIILSRDGKIFRRNTCIGDKVNGDRTYLTSFGEVVTPTLMVDAPLSRTMTRARFMAKVSDYRLCNTACRFHLPGVQ